MTTTHQARTMRAVVLPGPDQPPAVQPVPVPAPAPGEVLVRMRASSVNPHDAMVASGAAARYMTYEFPTILGSDVCGVVEAVGSDVEDLGVGDRVLGLLRERIAARGSFAELVAVPREWLTPVPATVSDQAAGALGLAALTALRCRDAITADAGDVVLVNGASGGVGSYLVQLLVQAGARVVATARPGEQHEHVLRMGAAATVDWGETDVATPVRHLHPEGVNAVVDLATRDKGTLAALANTVLAPGGIVVSTNHAVDPTLLPGARTANLVVEADRPAIDRLADLAAQGALRTAVTASFPLESVPEALAHLSSGALGKVAITFP